MRHQVGGRKLNRRSQHREAMLQNLVADLITYGRISTTVAKAKEARGFAEEIITSAKEPTLAARRRAIALLTNQGVVRKLFDEVAPRYRERPGGYTRIVRLMPRAGDAAPMALLELVEEKTA